jgi:hypothetical protein
VNSIRTSITRHKMIIMKCNEQIQQADVMCHCETGQDHRQYHLNQQLYCKTCLYGALCLDSEKLTGFNNLQTYQLLTPSCGISWRSYLRTCPYTIQDLKCGIQQEIVIISKELLQKAWHCFRHKEMQCLSMNLIDTILKIKQSAWLPQNPTSLLHNMVSAFFSFLQNVPHVFGWPIFISCTTYVL